MGKRKRVNTDDLGIYREILNSMITSIANAGYKQSVMLIGGLSLDMKLQDNKMLDWCRCTTDIDLDVSSVDLCDSLFNNVETILNENPNGFYFSVVGRRQLANMSAGIKLRCVKGDSEWEVKIDVNVRDITNVMIDFGDKSPLMVCDNYRAVVDKFRVLCSRSVFRRPKDLYDIVCYSRFQQYSYLEVKRRLLDAGVNFEDLQLMLYEPNIEKLQHAYDMNTALPDNTFFDVYSRASKFVCPLLTLLKRNEGREFVWDYAMAVWKESH